MYRNTLFTASAALLAIASAATFSTAATANDYGKYHGKPMKAENGPGPGPIGPGPGCNLIPAIASIGTVADISEFPAPDSVAVDPRLSGPVHLLRSGTFDIPIETLTRADPPADAKGTVTLPLYKGEVQTPSGPRPAWYVLLDASDEAEADRLGLNFAEKLSNAGDGARLATQRADGTFLFDAGVVDFSPDRILEPGRGRNPFPPRFAQPGAVGDADYSPLVTVGGITYDAPIVAAAMEDGMVHFPDGNPDYARVHDQVIAIDTVKRTVTLNLVNGFSFGKPVFYISSDASDPGVATIEANTFAPRLQRLEVGIDDIPRSAVERIFVAVNGPSRGGCENPQRQGLNAALTDGHRPNNVFGGIPTVALDYSPVWDANIYEWTPEAIRRGYRAQLNEEFRILTLARDGYITGPGGAPFGSAGPVIICGVAARLN
jgi:hypothetical protein